MVNSVILEIELKQQTFFSTKIYSGSGKNTPGAADKNTVLVYQYSSDLPFMLRILKVKNMQAAGTASFLVWIIPEGKYAAMKTALLADNAIGLDLTTMETTYGGFLLYQEDVTYGDVENIDLTNILTKHIRKKFRIVVTTTGATSDGAKYVSGSLVGEQA